MKTENGLLIDGGVLNNLPLSHITKEPQQLLIAVNVNANIPVHQYPVVTTEEKEKQSGFENKIKEFFSQQLASPITKKQEQNLGYFDLITKTIELMTSHNVQMALRKYPPDILISSARETCGIFEFHRAKEMVTIGHHIARESLDKYANEKENSQKSFSSAKSQPLD